MNAVHNRLHPVFTDEYLFSLNDLPATAPENARTLAVDIGVVIAPSTGEISGMYIRHASGVAEFDVAALSAFVRVFPMPVPAELESSDGFVYLEWELHRDRQACATLNARPYRLAPR